MSTCCWQVWHVTPSDAALCVSTQRAYWLAQGMGGSGILPPVLHNQHVLSHKQSLCFLVLSSASGTDMDKEKDKDKHTCCCLPQTIHTPSQLSQDKYPSILVLSSSKVNSQTDIINLWKGDGCGSSSSLHWKIPSPQPSFAINVCGDRGDRGHHGGCHRRKPQGISIPHTLYNTTVSWSHRWRILWKARQCNYTDCLICCQVQRIG